MDTHEGGKGRKPKMNVGFERELIHSITICYSGLTGSPPKRYAHVLTPETSEYELIWFKKGLRRYN